VWLVDGDSGNIRRHVPDPTVAARWHLDLGKIVKRSKAEVDALVLGPPLRLRPVLVKASGPGIYVLDDDLTVPFSPDGGSGSGSGGEGGSAGSGGSGGEGGSGAGSSDDASCSCGVAGRSGGAGAGLSVAAMIVMGAMRRRRR